MRRTLVLSMVILASTLAASHPGIGIVVDSAGNVFYTDLKRVWRIDPAGHKTIAVPNVHTHELYLDSGDNLYGEHLWYTGPQDGSGRWFHRVWKRMPKGEVVDIVPTTEGFRNEFSFVRDASGAMYFATDHESRATAIRKVTPEGRTEWLAGGAPGSRDGHRAQAGFADIRWITWGVDGNLYVADFHDVRRVTPEGSVVTVARGVAEHSPTLVNVHRRHDLMGLCADMQGNVYVANYGARVVKKIGRDGKITIFARSRFPWSPTGVAITRNKAYLLEYADPFAVKVSIVPLN